MRQLAVFLGLSAGAIGYLPAAPLLAEEAGVVVAAIPSAEARGTTGTRVLRATSEIFQGDRIVTGRFGEAQLKLSDNTKLVVGPRSALLVDDFIVASGGSAKKVTINAVRGAFRFITGSSRKSAYTIKTPSATIGIRGTEFDFSVDGNGATSVAVFSGGVDFCDRRRRQCVRLEGNCSIGTAGPQRRPELVDGVDVRQQAVNDLFPYIRSQQRLWQEFRVSSTGNCFVRRASSSPDAPATTGAVATLPPADVPDPGAPPPAPGTPPPAPGEPPPPAADIPGNPGNSNPVGNAGNPFGDGARGNSGNTPAALNRRNGNGNS